MGEKSQRETIKCVRRLLIMEMKKVITFTKWDLMSIGLTVVDMSHKLSLLFIVCDYQWDVTSYVRWKKRGKYYHHLDKKYKFTSGT